MYLKKGDKIYLVSIWRETILSNFEKENWTKLNEDNDTCHSH